ncbi:MAG: hypothetical protein J6V66_07235 [Clostridia bacterium]|nr:hypothetical protein [Clostridia bacterium]
MISLISTLVLLPPILSILKLENFNKENAFLNVSLNSYLESLEENAVISKVEFALDSGNFEYECVEIEYGYDNEQKYISKIVINLSSEVIIDESERINMIKEAKKLLSNVVDTQKVGVELETD